MKYEANSNEYKRRAQRTRVHLFALKQTFGIQVCIYTKAKSIVQGCVYTMLLKLICAVCFLFVLEDGLNKVNNQQNKHRLSPSSVEAGILKGWLSRIFKNARPPSNRRKADQASDNMDQATDIAREIADNKRSQEERERKEHEQRRAREKATRDERRMEGRDRNRNNGGGRDRSREKANRDRDRLDRGK